MSTGQEGTGKHGHKDTKEPWPHTQDQRSAGGREDSGRSGGSENRSDRRSDGRSDGSSQEASSREEKESLERREYRDDNGEVHHHTRTYEEQHRGDRH